MGLGPYISELRKHVGNMEVILVAASVLIFDEENRLLLQKRTDNGKWGIPGGYMEPGESIKETARREVFEETGLILDDLELFGIYSGEDTRVTLPNGHKVANVKVVFTCREYSGKPTSDSFDGETSDIGFFRLDEIPKNFFEAQLHTIEDLLSGKQPPFIK